ncbi:class I adenylate-forming enzyme family protein [Argonema antarcticum]|uniref:class I adenylate-forming enzyme family protein n=1 Tax=Argonema antarcticum TaxID=2942763 RepID=UPI002010FB89|nr:long-chain fatty acid--CoA ligase [Argonema antarcticum]MCL1475207.1 long-chain fatty acid--CoA ligase [Argonema antarcticum A004/B2]
MNIAQNIERGRRIFPRKTALTFECQYFSYEQLDEMANRVANGLQSLGIKKGDRVALYLPNLPEFVFTYFGILKLGAVVVSINVMLRRDEVWYILNDSGSKAIITTENLRLNVPDRDLVELQSVLLVESSNVSGLSLEELMVNASPIFQSVEMEPKDPATIVYTSGTTGFPKGAVLSHGNVVSNMHSQRYSCGMTANDKLLLYLPLFHCFGQNAILNSGLNAGATIILQRRFKPEQIVQAIAQEGATMFFGVPTVFAKLLEANLNELDWRSVRYYFSAAANLPIEIVRRWEQKFGRPIYQGYGLTETSPCASYNHPWKYKTGSIGMPIDNVEMKVVDEDDLEVPIGEWGEIIIRGPNVMLGYWKKPEETAKAIKNGWFHTGDIGYMDEDGDFYIVDRLKDMINVCGFKVYPSEVERVFYQHPAVAEVAVYGVADGIKGEVIYANVRLLAGELVTIDELMDFCRERMANYKVPQVINLVDSLPKNATGKILKTVLREEAIMEKKQL